MNFHPEAQVRPNLEPVRLGFDPKKLMIFQVAPPPAKYPLDTQGPQFYRALLDSLPSIPGVSGAALSSGIPAGRLQSRWALRLAACCASLSAKE